MAAAWRVWVELMEKEAASAAMAAPGTAAVVTAEAMAAGTEARQGQSSAATMAVRAAMAAAATVAVTRAAAYSEEGRRS